MASDEGTSKYTEQHDEMLSHLATPRLQGSDAVLEINSLQIQIPGQE